MDVAGKTAVITGGASGIGLATATRLATSGAKLVLGDIEDGPLDAAVTSARGDGATVLGVRCDVADLDDVEALRDAALAEFGSVHVVFNNAGVGGGPTIGSPIELWRWVSSVNLDGVVHGVHAFLPLLLDQDEGHVVNTASLAGLGGVPGMGPYCATKFAVVGLSESLFYDLALRRSARGGLGALPGVRAHADRRVGPQHARGRCGRCDQQRRPRRGRGSAAAAVVAAGIDPAVVAEHVAGAIERNEFWVLPHRHVAIRTTEQRLAWMQGGHARGHRPRQGDAGRLSLAVDAPGQPVRRASRGRAHGGAEREAVRHARDVADRGEDRVGVASTRRPGSRRGPRRDARRSARRARGGPRRRPRPGRPTRRAGRCARS